MKPASRRVWLLIAVLAIVTMAVYWPMTRYGFINYDDDVYVPRNRHVLSGLDENDIRWALTTFYRGFWIPLHGSLTCWT